MSITALELNITMCDDEKCNLKADFAIYDGKLKILNLCTYHKNMLMANEVLKILKGNARK